VGQCAESQLSVRFVCDTTLAFIKRCNVLSAIIEKVDIRERRACIKICFKLGKTATECYEMLKTAFGEQATGCFQTKTQSSQWKSPGSPRPKESRQVRSNIKPMLICFFDQKGTVHKEFVPPGQTVNAAFYVKVLKRLQDNVWRKWPDQWQNNKWLLHHDNAPTHAALLTGRFLTDNNMIVVPHPPYSPGLAPSDFFLFPKPKMKLKGWRFQMEEIQVELQAVLNTLWENDFHECFKNWQRCWDRCHASEGDYFEGDARP